MSDDPKLFEIMYSLRSMRRLKADPVSDELVWTWGASRSR